MACSACARSRNSTNANPRGRPVSRSTGSTTCDGGATSPKYERRSASVVLYARLPTNKRTANQLSPNGEVGRGQAQVAGAHTRQPESGSNLTRSIAILQAGIVAASGGPMTRRARAVCCSTVLCLAAATIGPHAAGGASSIRTQDLREWLTYIASDELEGRAIYTSGLGLASAYIADHLKAWGLKPAGDQASYLQTVRVLGVKSTSHASITIDVNGETRTFPDGAGVTLPKNMGGKRRFTIDRVEF